MTPCDAPDDAGEVSSTKLHMLWEKVQHNARMSTLTESGTALASANERVADDDDDDDDDNDGCSWVFTATHLKSVIVPVLKNGREKNGPRSEKVPSTTATDDYSNSNEDDVFKALECLLFYVSGESTVPNKSKDQKALVVSTGALEETHSVLRRSCLGDNFSDSEDMDDLSEEEQQKKQKTASLTMQVLAHLARNGSDVLKNDHLLPVVPTVLKAMHHHLLVSDNKDDDNERSDHDLAVVEVQRYGCDFLRQLSNPLLQELLAAGCTDAIVQAMKHFPNDGGVQEHGNACMYNLLPLMASSPSSPLRSPTYPSASMQLSTDVLLSDLPKIVVRGMDCHQDNLSVQQYGILVMKRLCQNDGQNYEGILQFGLTAVLRNIAVQSAEEQARQSPEERNDRECLAQLAIQFLQDLSKISNHSDMDMIRAIAAKGGIDAALQLVNPADSNPYKASVNIQDPAMAVLRNLCTHPDNRLEVITTSSSCNDIVSSVLSTMERFPDDAAIQAYGCDILGRLALARSTMTTASQNEKSSGDVDEDEKKPGEKSENDSRFDLAAVISRAYASLKTHRQHVGVQDRSIFVLVVLCSSKSDGEHAMECLLSQRSSHEETQKDVIAFVKATPVPSKGSERLKTLVEMLEGKIGLSVAVKKVNSPKQEISGKENNQNVLQGGWRKASTWIKSRNVNLNASAITGNITSDSSTGTASKPTISQNGGLSWRSMTSMSSRSATNSSSSS